MSRPELIVRALSFTCATFYKCVGCGVTARGDNVTIAHEDLEALPGDVSGHISTANISNNAMPVGWAGYGLDEHRCPECKT